jgi:hypothetical protein
MIHMDELTDMTKLTDVSCEITMATLQNKTNAPEMVGNKALICSMVLPAFMEKNRKSHHQLRINNKCSKLTPPPPPSLTQLNANHCNLL